MLAINRVNTTRFRQQIGAQFRRAGKLNQQAVVLTNEMVGAEPTAAAAV